MLKVAYFHFCFLHQHTLELPPFRAIHCKIWFRACTKTSNSKLFVQPHYLLFFLARLAINFPHSPREKNRNPESVCPTSFKAAGLAPRPPNVPPGLKALNLGPQAGKNPCQDFADYREPTEPLSFSLPSLFAHPCVLSASGWKRPRMEMPTSRQQPQQNTASGTDPDTGTSARRRLRRSKATRARRRHADARPRRSLPEPRRSGSRRERGPRDGGGLGALFVRLAVRGLVCTPAAAAMPHLENVVLCRESQVSTLQSLFGEVLWSNAFLSCVCMCIQGQ